MKTLRAQYHGMLVVALLLGLFSAPAWGQDVTVPDVVGQPLPTATANILAATLVVGTVSEQNSATVPLGSVIAQLPAAGATAPTGSAVDLLVSIGPALTVVPNVVGMTQTAAATAITDAYLAVGTVTEQFSATVPAGSVIAQAPAAGVLALPGTEVALFVSKGPQSVAVPNVVGQTLTDATASLLAATLVLGTVTPETSETVPAGNVISQSPAAATEVIPGTAVNLVVSAGPLAVVAVPDVVGMTQSAAAAAITGAGLVLGTVIEQPSETVPAGSVIAQAPIAGVLVVSGTPVALVVSSGPDSVIVPDVVGQTLADATANLFAANLMLGAVTLQSSVTVPAGNVISQSPAAASEVLPGSAVSLVVSVGTQPLVAVPNVVGMTQTAAATAITDAGLTVGTVAEQYSETVPVGSVIAQAPIAGVLVLSDTPVALFVSKGPQTVTVPDVTGKTLAAATVDLVAATLVLGTVTEESSDTVPLGSVISQAPAAGSEVAPASAVDLVVSTGPSDDGCFGCQICNGKSALDGLGKVLGDLFLVGLSLMALTAVSRTRM